MVLLKTIQDKLVTKLSPLALDLLQDQDLWEKYAAQLQQSIGRFNEISNSGFAEIDKLLNTKHLMSIWHRELPRYTEVINELSSNETLRTQVFAELSESDYFVEVWQIENPHHLMINLMILLYRTSMLHLHPQLKEQKAQVSSVIEEMAAILKTEGITSDLYQAVEHWLQNWKEEGFSETLFIEITSQGPPVVRIHESPHLQA